MPSSRVHGRVHIGKNRQVRRTVLTSAFWQGPTIAKLPPAHQLFAFPEPYSLVVLCASEQALAPPQGMRAPFLRHCISIQGCESCSQALRAPCHQVRQITSHCGHLRHQQRTSSHAALTMSTATEDGSFASVSVVSPAEEPADAAMKAAKDEASADAPTEEFRLQTIKDRMFWTHDSQVVPSHGVWPEFMQLLT